MKLARLGDDDGDDDDDDGDGGDDDDDYDSDDDDGIQDISYKDLKKINPYVYTDWTLEIWNLIHFSGIVNIITIILLNYI